MDVMQNRREAVMARENILVVDDEPDMRDALTAALQREGLCISTATNGVEALEKVQGQSFALIITDVRMPRMGGLALLQELKRTSPAIPVIMMTGYGRIEDAVEAMKAGAFDYLLKPFSLEDLKAVVTKALTPRYTPARPLAEPSRQEEQARYIHTNSPRSSQPFVAVNCAAIPEGLLESELFGHEKGAFTGAITKQVGKFEWAHRGTMLLDEISEMPLPLQAKLLRVLQEHEIERVGGRKPVPVDIRVIATTNRRLKDHMAAGKFREDLYYRLNVIPLNIPPLRERRGDIPALIEHFIRKHSRDGNQPLPQMSQDTIQHFLEYEWPGNIRELENMVERWLVLYQGGFLTSNHLFLNEGAAALPPAIVGKPTMSVREMERALIMETLQATNGNRTQAAKILGISLRTLRNKLREYRSSAIVKAGEQ